VTTVLPVEVAVTVIGYVPGAKPLELLLVVAEGAAPQAAIPIARHTTSKMKTSPRPRRRFANNIPTMLNGSRAKKMPRAPICPGVRRAEVPFPPDVLTVNWTVCVVVPSMLRVLGENEQEEPVGPRHVKPMVLLNPFTGATVRTKLAGLPWGTLILLELGVTVKSAPVGPVEVLLPVMVTFCGEFDELPLTLKVAFSTPLPVGLNVRLTVQEPEPAKTNGGVAQVVDVIVKSVFPVSAMLETVRPALALLDTVTTCALLVLPCAWLPKVRVAGDSEMVPEPATPVPLNATAAGIPAPLPLMVRVPVRWPVAVGLKATLMMQVAFGASVVRQAFVLIWKSPVIVAPVMIRFWIASVF